MDCLFCSIAAGDIPAKIIDSDDVSVAFLDIEPFQDGHTLVISRKHVTSVLDDDGELARISPMVTKVARRLVDSLGASGVNIMSNAGEVAGQSVHHLHIHVIPRYDREPGISAIRSTMPRRPIEEVAAIVTGDPHRK
ncbi:HIT domain-containing protein [Cutibacterium sp. WCA-380-WT-3A]|uniref:HIT domain-containing protein n=1 Tax=Cutibacterium porci TaxID=2605781 RepID=A0A7K0J5Q8_9ACTN|nr:HIT domain-containing protein [Cutibacterium porci]MSS45242.1 HIT domain-containing protein [Cutibacterium porci]